jgi:muramoyltetrapeptide carboxypeptidase
VEGCGAEQSALRTIRPGRASGRLTGGNLSVLVGTIGTPFEIETAGRIVFLEDVGERLYRIDRYLAQLWLTGKLQAAAGVLLGSFTPDEQSAEPAEEVAALWSEYFSRLDVPVLAGFPAGHTRYNLTLPMGAMVKIDADDKRVTVCENAVAVGSS